MKTLENLICKLIIEVLKEWGDPMNCCSEFDAMWYGYQCLSDELSNKYTLKEIKSAMKKLKNDGLVELKPIYDTDFLLCGSGWFISND